MGFFSVISIGFIFVFLPSSFLLLSPIFNVSVCGIVFRLLLHHLH